MKRQPTQFNHLGIKALSELIKYVYTEDCFFKLLKLSNDIKKYIPLINNMMNHEVIDETEIQSNTHITVLNVFSKMKVTEIPLHIKKIIYWKRVTFTELLDILQMIKKRNEKTACVKRLKCKGTLKTAFVI